MRVLLDGSSSEWELFALKIQVDIVTSMLGGFKLSNCVSCRRIMQIPNRKTRFLWPVGNDGISAISVVWCFRRMIKKGVGVSGLILSVVVWEGAGGVMA